MNPDDIYHQPQNAIPRALDRLRDALPKRYRLDLGDVEKRALDLSDAMAESSAPSLTAWYCAAVFELLARVQTVGAVALEENDRATSAAVERAVVSMLDAIRPWASGEVLADGRRRGEVET